MLAYHNYFNLQATELNFQYRGSIDTKTNTIAFHNASEALATHFRFVKQVVSDNSISSISSFLEKIGYNNTTIEAISKKLIDENILVRPLNTVSPHNLIPSENFDFEGLCYQIWRAIISFLHNVLISRSTFNTAIRKFYV